MVRREEHENLIIGINNLLAEEGRRAGQWQVGTFTAKQLLLRAGMTNTENNWRYVLHVMKIHYPDSTWERGSRDEGYTIRIRTRTK